MSGLIWPSGRFSRTDRFWAAEKNLGQVWQNTFTLNSLFLTKLLIWEATRRGFSVKLFFSLENESGKFGIFSFVSDCPDDFSSCYNVVLLENAAEINDARGKIVLGK